MKHKIYMKSWLELHDRTKTVDTDRWYLDFSNSLLPLIGESYMYKDSPSVVWKMIALQMTLYLEDCIANGGNWQQFINWHLKSYGRYLPFYTLSENYLSDEINKEDISFLQWTVLTPIGDGYIGVENPMDKDLLEFTEVLYERLDAVFEEAPISEHLAENWLMDTKLMEKKRRPLPIASLGDKLPADVELFLQASGGESLMYFDSYAALTYFLTHSLQWENDEDGILPDLKVFTDFVLCGTAKGLLIGIDVAQYFADERNELYNAEEASDEAYELFCEQGACPFDLLKYAMEYNLLPDAQFPFENGKALLHDNWDFVAKWFLDEYYEGD